MEELEVPSEAMKRRFSSTKIERAAGSETVEFIPTKGGTD